MSEGICISFNKAIIQSMFKHVASENAPLVLILQSYSKIFIAKHIDWDLVELICTTKSCEINCVSRLVTKLSFRPVKKFYELRKLYKYEKKKLPTVQFL